VPARLAAPVLAGPPQVPPARPVPGRQRLPGRVLLPLLLERAGPTAPLVLRSRPLPEQPRSRQPQRQLRPPSRSRQPPRLVVVVAR
jgi:hypothetical protein